MGLVGYCIGPTHTHSVSFVPGQGCKSVCRLGPKADLVEDLRPLLVRPIVTHMTLALVGLSLLATTYPEDKARSRAMGFALGGMAVGVLGMALVPVLILPGPSGTAFVLVGYPLGGFVYGFCTKFALFLLIFWVVIICGGMRSNKG